MKLSFTSLIQVKSSNKGFFNFDNYWIQKSDVVPLNYKEKIFQRIKIFRNVRYKWGGKKFDGVDCSGLIQLFYKFNNLYCPRDTGPQFKYFKKLRSIKKDSITNVLNQDLDLANKLLSRTWSIEGQVQKGKKLGSEMEANYLHLRQKPHLLHACAQILPSFQLQESHHQHFVEANE